MFVCFLLDLENKGNKGGECGDEGMRGCAGKGRVKISIKYNTKQK